MMTNHIKLIENGRRRERESNIKQEHITATDQTRERKKSQFNKIMIIERVFRAFELSNFRHIYIILSHTS